MSEPRRAPIDLGVGVGLRVPHYRHVLQHRPAVDFFEIISENFMVEGGKPRFHLSAFAESYRLVPHGVSLGIGGPEAPDREYLARLKELVRRVDPPWVSDHFCWCGAGGAHLHDLLPLPHTAEVVRLVADRARMVQDYLEVPFALENTSSYLTYAESTMTEWQCLAEVVDRADVGLLLDVNNVYVNARNHGTDPSEFLRSVPHARIHQVHVAGHTDLGTHVIDTHRGPIIDAVWDLYREAIFLAGPVSTIIEWDDAIPEWEVLVAEAGRARAVRDEALRARAAGARPVPPRRPAPLLPERPAAPAPDGRQGGPRERAAEEAWLGGTE